MHLSDFMAAQGLSDEQVGSAIGRTRATISRIRRRKMRPDWSTITALREFSGGQCTADDFESLDIPAENAA